MTTPTVNSGESREVIANIEMPSLAIQINDPKETENTNTNEELSKFNQNGLTDDEIEQNELRSKYGFNETLDKPSNPLLLFLSFFVGFLPCLIEAAAILAGALEQYTDMAIIIALLFINALIGFNETRRGAAAVQSLSESIPHLISCCRNNKWGLLEHRLLLPGDLISVKPGDLIPADGILIKVHGASGGYLSVDESSITGESKPRKKFVKNKVLSGGIVKQGEGNIIITQTGLNTQAGQTKHLVNTAPPSNHFQKVTRRIAIACVLVDFMCLAIIIPIAVKDGFETSTIILFSLVITIASIPIALPTVLSITMAIGSQRLKKYNAVVSRLTAVEELSALTILCCDKTGTLTQNLLSVDTAIPASNNFNSFRVLFYANLASSRHKIDDPIDSAIVKATDKLIASKEGESPIEEHEIRSTNLEFNLSEINEWQQELIRPFDPVSKRVISDCLHIPSNSHFQICKGAPQAVFALVENQNKKSSWPQKLNENTMSEMDGLKAKDEENVENSKSNKVCVFHEGLQQLPVETNKNSENSQSFKDRRTSRYSVAGNSKILIKMKKDVEELAAKGLRAIAIAIRQRKMKNSHQADSEPKIIDDKDQAHSDQEEVDHSLNDDHFFYWELVGIIPLLDPPRIDSQATIAKLEELGIIVKMITGDQVEIGKDTAGRLGMGEKFVYAHELRKLAESSDPKDIKMAQQMALEMNGMGEAYPQDKYNVVKLLQSAGHCVGMTGDGANDAPALALSNVGIAVAGATEAARLASDLVLLSDGLSVIANSIIEARKIFARMNGYAIYRFEFTMHLLLVLSVLIIAYGNFLNSNQVILLAVANDFIVISIAFDESLPSPLPTEWNLFAILTKAFALSIVQFFSTLIMIVYLNFINISWELILTFIYLQLTFCGSSAIFVIRTSGSLITPKNRPSSKLVGALLFGHLIGFIFAFVGIGMAPLNIFQILYLTVYCLLTIICVDFCKQIYDQINYCFLHRSSSKLFTKANSQLQLNQL